MRTSTLFILMVMPSLGAPSVFATSAINGPTQSTTGSYTLTWETNCDGGFQWTQLLENSQVVTSSVMCPASFTANGRPDGVYVYQVQGCFTNQFTGTICFDVGDSHTVTVNSGGSGPPPAGDGVVRQGDANGNGLIDLYIAPETGDPFLLQQISGQSFQLVTGLSSGQMNAYASWPQSAAFLVESDLNVSGAKDLMVRDVDVVIPGADEWVVFRNLAGNAASIMPMDFHRESFIGQLFAWSLDRDFFVNVAIDQGWYTETTEVGFFAFTWLIANQVSVNGQLVTGDPWNPNIEPDLCAITYCFFYAGWGWYAYLQMTFQELDFSNFHEQAIAVLQQIQQVELGNAVMRSVVDIFESVLGPITCNGVDPARVIYWDADRPPSYFEDGECTWYILGRYMGVLRQDPTADLQVELRTRPVQWPFDPQHLSVHDPRDDAMAFQRVSAFPVNGFLQALIGNAGTVEAVIDADSDHPDVTVIVAYLSAPATDFSQAWTETLNATLNFDNQARDYCPLPSPGGSCFNSNGWAIGLVNSLNFGIEPLVWNIRMNALETVAITFDPADDHYFIGITNPVPVSDFQ